MENDMDRFPVPVNSRLPRYYLLGIISMPNMLSP